MGRLYRIASDTSSGLFLWPAEFPILRERGEFAWSLGAAALPSERDRVRIFLSHNSERFQREAPAVFVDEARLIQLRDVLRHSVAMVARRDRELVRIHLAMQ